MPPKPQRSDKTVPKRKGQKPEGKGKPEVSSDSESEDSESNMDDFPTGESFKQFMRRSISGLQHSINKIALQQQNFLERITKVERQQTEIISSLEHTDKDVQENKKLLDTIVLPELKELRGTVQALQKENEELKQRVLDSERYSRGFNLRFGGIEEKVGENPKDLIDEVIKKHLNMPDITLENVHRTGEKRPGQNRHIVAKFIYRPERREVLFQARQMLKDSPMFVTEDLIPEDRKKKSFFREHMNLCFNEGKKVRFTRGKLYVDGKEVREEDIAPSRSVH